MRRARGYNLMESRQVTRTKMIVAAILAASLFTGCKVGPNYKRPSERQRPRSFSAEWG
jgi:uncharacterized membrane protein (DUF441 family)